MRIELTGPKIDDAAVIESASVYISGDCPFELDFRNSRIGGEAIASICTRAKGKLRELDLAGTQVDDDMLEALPHANELVSLTLDSTRITNKSVKVLLRAAEAGASFAAEYSN